MRPEARLRRSKRNEEAPADKNEDNEVVVPPYTKRKYELLTPVYYNIRGDFEGKAMFERAWNMDVYIDSAFRSSRTNHVFMFTQYEYVVVEYDPATPTKDRVVKGPFDAALESSVTHQAYLFIKLIATGLITEVLPCLCNTIFATGIGAAFASHTSNEAYLFKDNYNVLIHFNPAETNDSYIIVGPEDIVPTNWPSLQGIVPYKNMGLDSIEPKPWSPVFGPDGPVRVPLDSPSLSQDM